MDDIKKKVDCLIGRMAAHETRISSIEASLESFPLIFTLLDKTLGVMTNLAVTTGNHLDAAGRCEHIGEIQFYLRRAGDSLREICDELIAGRDILREALKEEEQK